MQMMKEKKRERLQKRIKREKIVATQYFIRAHNGRYACGLIGLMLVRAADKSRRAERP